MPHIIEERSISVCQLYGGARMFIGNLGIFISPITKFS